jgi:uncharacterized protein (TIRG00374 family)
MGMSQQKKPALGPLRTLLPLVLGLSVVAWILQGAVTKNGGWDGLEGAMALPDWPVALAGLMTLVLLRDIGYVCRLKWLSAGRLSWKQAVETTVLWEFASAITPGIVGGGAVAIWGLHRQGMSAGRSTALVFSTALLDEMFYVLAVPPLILLLGNAVRPDGLDHAFGWGAFWAGWALMLLLAVVIGFGLFLAPRSTHRIIRSTGAWRPLRRWKRNIIRFAEDLRESAEHMKTLSLGRWAASFAATMVSWTSRFLCLVAVMGMVVAPLEMLDTFLIVARQLVMWVVLLISPTPGSSGVAEWLLNVFFGEWFERAPSPISAAITMLIWRMATHFIYLLIGVLVIPGWLRRSHRRNPI